MVVRYGIIKPVRFGQSQVERIEAILAKEPSLDFQKAMRAAADMWIELKEGEHHVSVQDQRDKQ